MQRTERADQRLRMQLQSEPQVGAANAGIPLRFHFTLLSNLMVNNIPLYPLYSCPLPRMGRQEAHIATEYALGT